ncbi:hypothetical protein EON82_25175, partial [bacterium]
FSVSSSRVRIDPSEAGECRWCRCAGARLRFIAGAFGRFHLQAFPEMQMPTATVGPERGYGFGWGIDKRGFLDHSGSMVGVRTMLRLVTTRDLVITVVANGETDVVGETTDDLAATVTPDFPLDPGDHSRPKDEVPAKLYGARQGMVEAFNGEVPLCFRGDKGFEMRSERLFGLVDGEVATEDAGRRPYRLHLVLTLSGEGAVLTVKPGQRLGNALSYRGTFHRVG